MDKDVIAGRNGVIYRTFGDSLARMDHLDFANGGAAWGNNGHPMVIGVGWGRYKTVLASNHGVVYGITADGTLYWHQDRGRENGGMLHPGGLQIGTGWNMFTRVMAGDDGLLYGITPEGELFWFKHDDHATVAATGRAGWRPRTSVGKDWHKTTWSGVGSNGAVYVIWPDGNLSFYKHGGYLDGADAWPASAIVGDGWGTLRFVTASNDGVLYTVDNAGSLSWYRHSGQTDRSWQRVLGIAKGFGPSPIASGPAGGAAPVPPELIDGTYTIKAKSNGKYLCREGQHYVGNRDSAGPWEKFRLLRQGNRSDWTIFDYQDEALIREPTFEAVMPQKHPTLPVIEDGGIALRETFLHNGTVWTIDRVSGNDYSLEAAGHYLTVEPSGLVAVNRTERQDWETFTLTRVGD